MPNKRDLKLDKYDIGTFAYRELHNFCLQYPEKKKRLAELRYPYNSPQISELPRGATVGDPTGKNAERAAILSSDCELIEQTVLEAAGDDYQCLLLSVTQDVPHHYLQMLKGLETGRHSFNEKRRYFFYLLAKKKRII